MPDKKMVDRANEELRKLHEQLANTSYEIEHLQVDETLDQANAVREGLITLRQRLVNERYSGRGDKKEIESLKTQVHKALIAITEAVPANRRKLSGELECPITLQALKRNDTIALSNGCLYDRDTIAGYARGQSEFPSKLPGSDIELSEKDAEDAAKAASRRGARLGGFIGAGLGALLWYAIPYALTAIWGIHLSGMLAGSLLAAGLTAAATTGIVFGVFAAALIVSMVAIAAVGAVAGGMAYYQENKSAELGEAITIRKVFTTGKAQQVLVEMDEERIALKPQVESGLVEGVEDDRLDEGQPPIALSSRNSQLYPPASPGAVNNRKSGEKLASFAPVTVGVGRGQGH